MMHRNIPIVFLFIQLCGCHAEKEDMTHSIAENYQSDPRTEEENAEVRTLNEKKHQEKPEAVTCPKGKPSREAVAGPPERISAHLHNQPPENRCFTIDDLPKLSEPSSPTFRKKQAAPKGIIQKIIRQIISLSTDCQSTEKSLDMKMEEINISLATFHSLDEIDTR